MLFDVKMPILDWFFPVSCCVCDGNLYNLKICNICLDLCHRNENPTIFTDNCYTFLYYFEHSIRKIIKSIKYKNDLYAFYALFDILNKQMSLSPLIEELILLKADAITYVPGNIFTRFGRTINLPSLWASWLAIHLGIKVVPMLGQKSFRQRQAMQKNKYDRITQVKDSFFLQTGHKKFNKLILVDDVVTTGATLKEARRTLLSIGRDVQCVVLAKTP
jgi:predicted amidophosphoribosyltransferase